MKRILLSTLILLGMLMGVVYAQDNPTFANKQDSISYALGVDIGKNLNETEIPLNYDALYKGLIDFIQLNQAEIDEATCQALIQDFSRQAQQKQIAKMQQQASEAAAKGNQWLTENKAKDGVVELPSGLQYKVIQAGNGAKPTMANTVKVHYEGTLLDGTKFDSSYDRGEPIEFPLGNVIRGWQEGLQQMSPGAKYELYIPGGLAYGERGSPPTIGPNETLIFIVELLEVK
ncbi:MAG: FKBP-type peptidyl-prolyl cis-trans isomerase [Bacteroidia bacterium]|nr:FKBP-type peptidyl-prolyl cis-trans isomerase [Bacteroidia bacterium]